MKTNDEIDGFLRLKEVLKIIPVSSSHWWNFVKNKKYPQPIKLSPKVTVWRRSDILKLINEISKST